MCIKVFLVKCYNYEIIMTTMLINVQSTCKLLYFEKYRTLYTLCRTSYS